MAADATDLAALSLEQLMEMNVHSVYGASKYEQRVTQAPSSISIVTSEDIRRFGYTTRVLLLVDGHRLNDNVSSSRPRAKPSCVARGWSSA